MPMGLVKDSEFEAELNNSKSKTTEVPAISGEVIDYSKGRGHNPEVPDSLRKIIGETGIVDGRREAVDLAKKFDISPSSVSAYTNGSTSTASYDSKPLAPHLNKAKERIQKRAQAKLHKALNAMTEDKFDEAKVGELAAVAKTMSSVIKDMEPEQDKPDPSKNGPTFIFYSPSIKQENSFDVVYAKE